MYDSIHTPNNVAPLVRRQARTEWELNFVLQECVFEARSTEHLQELLAERLYSNEQYMNLPKFRAIALDAYMRGLLDAVARMQGMPAAPQVSLQKPKARPRAQLHGKSEDAKLHSTKGGTTRAVPGWAAQTQELTKDLAPVHRNAMPPAAHPAPVVEVRRPPVKKDPRAESEPAPQPRRDLRRRFSRSVSGKVRVTRG